MPLTADEFAARSKSLFARMGQDVELVVLPCGKGWIAFCVAGEGGSTTARPPTTRTIANLRQRNRKDVQPCISQKLSAQGP
jgi:hypothetical protein